jgi:hypothetical protein
MFVKSAVSLAAEALILHEFFVCAFAFAAEPSLLTRRRFAKVETYDAVRNPG